MQCILAFFECSTVVKCNYGILLNKASPCQYSTSSLIITGPLSRSGQQSCLLGNFIYLFLLKYVVSFIRIESQLSLPQEINIDLRRIHGCRRKVRTKSPKYCPWKTTCNRKNCIHNNSSRPFFPTFYHYN